MTQKIAATALEWSLRWIGNSGKDEYAVLYSYFSSNELFLRLLADALEELEKARSIEDRGKRLYEFQLEMVRMFTSGHQAGWIGHRLSQRMNEKTEIPADIEEHQERTQ